METLERTARTLATKTRGLDSIARCEELYPTTTETFKRYQHEGYKLFCEKQLDYGPDNIKAGTQLETTEDRNWSLTGLSFRINDKVTRLVNLLKTKAKPNNESIEDTLMDLSNYAIIGLVVKNGKWAK
jgi:hypothetical protein|tara:strand:+ start:179 stop:562 length:384 start_codon:yes stop_codon:yes gene_type:complete